MKKNIKNYESAVDLLVAHSAGRFKTPYGVMTGQEVLEKIWFRHTPEKAAKEKEAKGHTFSVQRKIWGESPTRVLENGSVEFKASDGWYRIQFNIEEQ
jgi:hypothetical protein